MILSPFVELDDPAQFAEPLHLFRIALLVDNRDVVIRPKLQRHLIAVCFHTANGVE